MNDAQKIGQIKEILKSQNLEKVFEVVSLVLSIEDEEDRDLSLLDAVQWLLKNEFWQKAYGAAQLMSENYEKSEALEAVAEYLASIGHLEKALPIFAEAEKASLNENLADWQKAERLHKIAKSLQKVKAVIRANEIWEKAIEIAQKGEDSPSSQDSIDSSSVLSEIAENFAAEKRFEEATLIAQKLKNRKERTLQRITDYSQQVKRVA